jgi:hypothetical protein
MTAPMRPKCFLLPSRGEKVGPKDPDEGLGTFAVLPPPLTRRPWRHPLPASGERDVSGYEAVESPMPRDEVR